MVVLVLLTFGGGGGVQNRESPDFRCPEVGRYERGRFVLPVNNFLWQLFRLLGVKGMKINWLTPFFAH